MASCCSVRGRASRLLEALVNQSLLNKVSRNISHVSGRSQITETKQGRLYPQLACEMWAASPWRCGRSRRGLHLGVAQPQLHQTGRQTEEPEARPHQFWEGDLKGMVADIKKELNSNQELREIARYYFDGQGKAIRPMVTVLMARAINDHVHSQHRLSEEQRQVAMIAEMIHTASLVHDDVIDGSDTRRGKPSVSFHYGQRKAIMAGDYILSVAATMLARLRNEDVVIVLSQVLADLVQGEFMQLGSKENENERFAHYLQKSFKKTASLMAYSCKAVAILSGASESVQEVAFQYGRNTGLAFQLADDLFDFVASSKIMGKPTTIDLKLGLATAPVLFACEKFPELNPMIMRRFQEPGDVQKAFEYVHKSDGLDQTQFLAEQHCQEAIKVISTLKPSAEQKALISFTDKIINRAIQSVYIQKTSYPV